MTTVWMLSSGSYSDYEVEGIFSSKEKGEAWLAKLGKTVERHRFNELEEFPVDYLDPDKLNVDSSATMGFRTGNLLEYKLHVFPVISKSLSVVVFSSGYLAEWNQEAEPTITMYFNHRDKEKIIKVLAEKRAQMLAQHSHDSLRDGYYSRDTLERVV